MNYLGYGNAFLDTIPQAWSMNKKWQVKLIKMKKTFTLQKKSLRKQIDKPQMARIIPDTQM